MSQFNFPRIHFKGRASIDPATGNNNYHYPLVTYEPISATVVLPPRIYLDPDDGILAKAKELKIDKYLKHDSSGAAYLLITGIDNAEIFKSWNVTPLGTHHADMAFHGLYSDILTKKEQKPLSGQCPGYWNYG